MSSEPDIVAGGGAWLSSFTLAVTEVTERAELPWLTMAYADQITVRGFKNVFQTSLVSSAMAEDTVPTALNIAEKATGKRPDTRSTSYGTIRRPYGVREAPPRRRPRANEAEACR